MSEESKATEKQTNPDKVKDKETTEKTASPKSATPAAEKATPSPAPSKKRAGAKSKADAKTASKKKAVEEPSDRKEDSRSPMDMGDLNFYGKQRDDLPAVRSGDVVNVAYRIVEGGKEKIQNYKGTVIGQKGSGVARTVTVRKISFGIGVERIFPLNSKFLKSIEVLRRSKVRQSKLYYLRKLRGKAARLKPLR